MSRLQRLAQRVPSIRQAFLRHMGRASVRLLLTFALLVALGTLYFLLSGSVADPKDESVVDLVFTATSAVCVTGLTVLDTEYELTFAGRLGILVLIQLGALGLLTLSNWFLLTVRHRRLGLRERLVLEQTHGSLAPVPPRQLLRQIILFTLVWEGLGACVLWVRFLADMPFGQALWCAVFHAVSAFCNAGFSTFSDSLERYRGDVVVNLVMTTLIIAGGLGFVVFGDISRTLAAPRRTPLALHTRIVLYATAFLVVGGAIAFLLFESGNKLNDLPVGERVLSSIFLSVTSRTAGFNTVPTAALTNTTLLALVMFMFIGASPGSTGGGVKTTAVVLLGALFRSRIRSRDQVEIFHRTVPRDLVTKALMVVLVFGALVALGSLLLTEFEGGFESHLESRKNFLDYLFETVSAVCTVGLSTGITASLSASSKLVLVGCMFIGRLGPLLVADSLLGARREVTYSYPEERILVG